MAKKEDKIAERAYFKYIKRGAEHGRDMDDWIEAEKELTKKSTTPRKTKTAATKTTKTRTKAK